MLIITIMQWIMTIAVIGWFGLFIKDLVEEIELEWYLKGWDKGYDDALIATTEDVIQMTFDMVKTHEW